MSQEDLENLISFEDREGYEYVGIRPSELGEKTTRLSIGYKIGEAHWGLAPDSRWEEAIKIVLDALPEMGEFKRSEEDPYRFVSEKAFPAKKLAEKIKKLPIVESCSKAILKNEGSSISFHDLEKYSPFGGYPGNLEKVALDVPKWDGQWPFQSFINFEIDRGGHDGAANGGSYGWYYRVWSDGKIAVERYDDRSTRSYGHRLNYHHDDYNAVARIQNGSWVVVQKYYKGLIYSHDDSWFAYGEPPKNFRRFESRLI